MAVTECSLRQEIEVLTRTEVNLQAPGEQARGNAQKGVSAQHSRHSASLRSFLTIHDTRQRRLVTYFSVHIRILLDFHTRFSCDISTCVCIHIVPSPTPFSSFFPSIHPSSIIMATHAPATGASALTTDVTAGPATNRSDAAPQKKIRVVKPVKIKKCCFNEPGGPWPR